MAEEKNKRKPPARQCGFTTELRKKGPSFAGLPHLPLENVFKYLDARERFKIGRVCRTWYNASRISSLWKFTNIHDLRPSEFLNVLPCVPNMVKHLRLCCRYYNLVNHKRLMEVLLFLSKTCSDLESLRLENVHFENELHDPMTARWCTAGIEKSKKRKKTTEQLVMNELVVLSLSTVAFTLCDLFSHIDASGLPKLSVLNFYQCHVYCEGDFSVLSQFTNLTELYLTESWFSNGQVRDLLEAARRLTVIDIEFSDDVEEILPALKLHGQSLEKLYMRSRRVTDREISDLITPDSFPHLKELCVRLIYLEYRTLDTLLNFNSLRRFYLSKHCVPGKFLLEHTFPLTQRKTRWKIRFYNDAENFATYPCTHFRDNHGIGFRR